MSVSSKEQEENILKHTTELINIPIENTWTTNIERILDKLRINCCQLSNFHKYKYKYCKGQIKWFRLPIITITSVNTFASVGLQEHLQQETISIITSVLSLIIGIITGIEMFMKYQDKMESELATHKEYYRISVDIFKMISIDRQHRKVTGKDFLEEKFSEYEKIKSRSRPEEPTDLMYDVLADMEDLYLYKRRGGIDQGKGWVNKIELAPPLYSKEVSSLGVSYDRFRNPEKYALREQSKKIENKVKITQKYIDDRWKYKKDREHKDNKQHNNIIEHYDNDTNETNNMENRKNDNNRTVFKSTNTNNIQLRPKSAPPKSENYNKNLKSDNDEDNDNDDYLYEKERSTRGFFKRVTKFFTESEKDYSEEDDDDEEQYTPITDADLSLNIDDEEEHV
jgi:hypothetical protein